MAVVVRFAPSPTGPLHIGGVRTALFNYLYAKQEGGRFILRIEDTDRARSKPEFEKNILDSLEWLGLDYDACYHQSERSHIYEKHLKNLIASGHAYVSQESVAAKEGDRPGTERRAEVIRLKSSKPDVTFTDLIRGEIKSGTAELGDFIIAKSLTEPLYHLAVVIDDWEMGVTHVIRGEDHISNTPRQILIQEALGAPRPAYAHIPLILAPDRSKLSKRHGAVAVTEYREQGFLKESLLNYLPLLGWNPGTDQELFSLAELIQKFKLEKIQKAGAIFNLEKLRWFNGEYIKRLTDAELASLFPAKLNRTKLLRILPLVRERLTTIAKLDELVAGEGEFAYFFHSPDYPRELLKTQAHLPKLRALLSELTEGEFTPEKIKATIMPYADSVGRGEVLWPMRVALTGRERSADPFTVAALLGQAETIARLDYASKLA
ncbi:MAG: glutamate--tRNA ligase family protein [Patescibacteria group bacterium]|mgnify:CR=1 FL=1